MAKEGKKILILGNGFDLAHGLPTKYSDFLEFCKIVENIIRLKEDEYFDGRLFLNSFIFKNNQEELEETKNKDKDKIKKESDIWKIDKEIKNNILEEFYTMIDSLYEGKSEKEWEKTGYLRILLEIYENIINNIWYKYFIMLYEDKTIRGENWIDFESEICFIIKEIDKEIKQKKISLMDKCECLEYIFGNENENKNFINIFFKTFDYASQRFSGPTENASVNIHIEKRREELTIRDFREEALKDLEKITRALELYLAEFVEKIEIEKIPEIEEIKPDYIINFNYTHTYEKNYNKDVEVHHIHGETNLKRKIEDNNMVLGINEYWSDEEKDDYTNFTIFKKFAQRIQKHTGSRSYEYLRETEDIAKNIENNGKISDDKSKYISEVYVFGHSLDITDKDILSGFIGSDATSVTIYCRDKETEGELIANTIRLIGQDKLLSKSNRTIANLEYKILK